MLCPARPRVLVSPQDVQGPVLTFDSQVLAVRVRECRGLWRLTADVAHSGMEPTRVGQLQNPMQISESIEPIPAVTLDRDKPRSTTSENFDAIAVRASPWPQRTYGDTRPAVTKDFWFSS